MKIALYIEDGLEQIVLTPDTDTEAGILAKLSDRERDLNIKRGSFFKCQGGWVRYGQPWRGPYDSRDKDDESTIIMLTPKPTEVAAITSTPDTWIQNGVEITE